MIPAADREALLAAGNFTLRGQRKAARMPLCDLERLVEERTRQGVNLHVRRGVLGCRPWRSCRA